MAKSFTVTVPNIKNVDDIFEILGGFGRFQFLILVLLLCLEIPAAFVVFSPVFTGATPNEWLCDNVTVLKTDPDFCACNGSLTAISPGSSIVAEWGLICETSWASDFITTLQMLGMVFGNFLTGQFADWYGRRWAYLGTVSWLFSGTLISALAPNIYVYAVARVLAGMGFSGYIFLSMTYSMEFMTPSYRVLCSSVGPLGEGIMALGALGYYFQDSWRNLLLASATPYIMIVIIFPLLPESPRWLLTHRKIEEASKVFNYVARINRTTPMEIDALWKVADFDKDGEAQKIKKISYIQFFKNKEVRFVTFCLCLIWCTWSIMYFGISYNIKNIGGNPYLNVIYMGMCDAVGYKLNYVVNAIFTRRRSLSIFMTGAASFLISLAVAMLFFDAGPIVILTLCLLGKFCASAARASARLLTGESFPTDIRNMGFGIVGVSASVVGLVAPQLAYIGSRWPSAPLFVFAACSLLGASASFLLKETKGQPLNEEVGKKNRRISIASIVETVRRLSLGGERK